MNTHHVQIRTQQRSIPPLVMQWLEDFGDEVHDHHGGIILHFGKRARRRLAKVVGREPVKRMNDWLSTYMVISTDGVRITAGIRYRRIKH
jgi:hypothetical protein